MNRTIKEELLKRISIRSLPELEAIGIKVGSGHRK
jgi:hypothetical protein